VRNRRAQLALLVISILLYVFLYAPIAAVMVQSFNAARHGAEWHGFTTHWYRTLARNDAALHATGITLALAATSAVVATTLGTGLAFGLSRGKFFGQPAAEWTLRTVIVVPDIVMAIALLIFYAVVRERLGMFEPGLLTMALAHITFQIPFVTLVVRARLTGLDPSLNEAARDLGANGWQAFRHITLPLIRPGILAGALLAFTLSLDDFVISFFTTGPGATTLPILIYSSVKRGITPDIHALSTLMVVVSVVATTAVMLMQKGNFKIQNRNPE
jgi:spermidine/putrescine transport system permease protein